MPMIRKPSFRNVNVLLADSDPCLAQAVMHNLRIMGFQKVTHVRTSADAVRTLQSQPVSFLITEWDIKGSSGIDLVRFIRRSNDSPNRGLPIIMLTGRGELTDVRTARDVGITEFVVKPFSAQTLFNRIEQIVEHPRSFVVADSYVGPERRRRGLPPPGVEDRRVIKPIAAVPSRNAFQAPPGHPPVLFSPDFSLRLQLGSKQPLSSLITAEVLEEAQSAINQMGDESMSWIREDLESMQQSFESIRKAYTPEPMEALKEAALSLKARSGTFGYRMASDVARLMYLFLSSDFKPTNSKHFTVIEKHLQVLMVIFAQKIKDREGVGAELYNELERLITMHK
jgi:CheY-like chemotaxis protein